MASDISKDPRPGGPARDPESMSMEREPSAMPIEPAPRGLRRLLTNRVLGATIVALLLLQGGLLAYPFMFKETSRCAEVDLGRFGFVANPVERSPIGAASFQLHVLPIPEADREVRDRIERRRNRVQQDVEELLRLAHGGDFADPTLGELKRQIQERINKTLDMRAVADVIITDLRVQRAGEGSMASTDAGGSFPPEFASPQPSAGKGRSPSSL